MKKIKSRKTAVKYILFKSDLSNVNQPIPLLIFPVLRYTTYFTCFGSYLYSHWSTPNPLPSRSSCVFASRTVVDSTEFTVNINLHSTGARCNTDACIIHTSRVRDTEKPLTLSALLPGYFILCIYCAHILWDISYINIYTRYVSISLW